MLFVGGLTSWTAFLAIYRSVKLLPFDWVTSSRRPKKPKPGRKGQNQAYVTKIRAKLKKRIHGPSM